MAGQASRTPAKKSAPKEVSPPVKHEHSQQSTQSKPVKTTESKSEHPAAQGVPLPIDPSAARLQEEQDELQQPGRVARGLGDQIDNDPGYSKDQLAHMKEYWSHGDAVGEEETADDEE